MLKKGPCPNTRFVIAFNEMDTASDAETYGIHLHGLSIPRFKGIHSHRKKDLSNQWCILFYNLLNKIQRCTARTHGISSRLRTCCWDSRTQDCHRRIDFIKGLRRVIRPFHISYDSALLVRELTKLSIWGLMSKDNFSWMNGGFCISHMGNREYKRSQPMNRMWDVRLRILWRKENPTLGLWW